MIPKISVALNTFQELYPIFELETDIFTFLLDSLKRQTFKDFELVVVDRYFEERKETFQRIRLDFPHKYCPPKPSPWHQDKVVSISSDRNSAIILSSGEIVVCIDDCNRLANDTFLEQVWSVWKDGYVLRPLTRLLDFSKTPPAVDRDPVEAWRDNQTSDVHYLSVSGNCPRCYIFPAEVFEGLNGFDERYDGAHGSEDSDFYERADVAGVKRVILRKDQCWCEKAHHRNDLYQHSTGLVCNFAYSQWNYARIRDRKLIRANEIKLDDHDVSQIRSMCEKCPVKSGCSRPEPQGLHYYLERQPFLDLRAMRKKMTKMYGDFSGAFDPWE